MGLVAWMGLARNSMPGLPVEGVPEATDPVVSHPEHRRMLPTLFGFECVGQRYGEPREDVPVAGREDAGADRLRVEEPVPPVP